MKLNLVIDASGIFYRSLYTVGNYGLKKNQKLLSTEQSQGVFMRKLATDFAALVKSVDNVNRVIVCLDSTSWRKKVAIKNGGYKISREEKDESIVDWDSFFKITKEFTEILGERGYILSKLKDAEADDLLFLWARKLNDMNESVIMVTGDRDLLQVLNLHENGSWTVALDPVSQRRKVSMTKETYDICNSEFNEDDVDLFDPSTWNSSPGDILFSLVDKNDVQIIDPVKVATMKVLLGDHGDSVPGIISWMENNKNGVEVMRSLSETRINKAIADLPEFTWKSLLAGDNVDKLTSKLLEVSKHKDFTYEDIVETIKRNVTLVILDEEIIPSDIQNNFQEKFKILASSPVHLTRDAILQGTKWWNIDTTPKSFGFSMDTKDSDKDIFNEPAAAQSEELKLAIDAVKNKTTEKKTVDKDKKGTISLF